MLVDLSAPLGTLGVLETECLDEAATVTFERRIGAIPRSSPVLRIDAVDPAELRTTVCESSAIDGSRLLNGREREHSLLEIDWAEDRPAFLETLETLDASILSARAEGRTWHLQLWIPDSSDASTLVGEIAGATSGVEVEKIDGGGTARDVQKTVTAAQREALELAVERGYFMVPRESTVEDLAAELGISDSAVSQRLRRAMATLLESSTTIDTVQDRPTHAEGQAGGVTTD